MILLFTYLNLPSGAKKERLFLNCSLKKFLFFVSINYGMPVLLNSYRKLIVIQLKNCVFSDIVAYLFKKNV